MKITKHVYYLPIASTHTFRIIRLTYIWVITNLFIYYREFFWELAIIAKEEQEKHCTYGSNSQHVEHFSAVSPSIGISILSLALIFGKKNANINKLKNTTEVTWCIFELTFIILTIKAIHLCNLPTLMIPTQQCDAVGPLCFKC